MLHGLGLLQAVVDSFPGVREPLLLAPDSPAVITFCPAASWVINECGRIGAALWAVRISHAPILSEVLPGRPRRAKGTWGGPVLPGAIGGERLYRLRRLTGPNR